MCTGKGSQHCNTQLQLHEPHLKSPCAGGRLVFLLEGGYDLKALGESVAETFRALLGKVPTRGCLCLLHSDLIDTVPQTVRARLLFMTPNCRRSRCCIPFAQLLAVEEVTMTSCASTWRQASADTFNADLLRDEPAEKVRAVLAEARAVHSL